MDLHDLTAGYALDALDPDERARYEEHLASCERCRDELQGFWQVAGALGRAAGGPTPPASLRERILEQARDERPNVVPLRRRVATPVLASAAAVAAVVAVALGIWSLGLSRDLDDANSVLAVLSDPNARVHESADGEANLVVTPTGRRRARRPDAGAGTGGQGLRDLGVRGRRAAAGGPVRAAGRRDAVAEGRAWTDGGGHARAGRRRRRADGRPALHRPSRRSDPVTEP